VVLVACSRGTGEQPGLPARLAAGGSDTLIINSAAPTGLGVRAFDAAGRVVAGAHIRYESADGAAVPVSSDGIATCDGGADHTVRARVENVSRSFVVRCRPIAALRISGPVQFVLGDSALAQPFELPLSAVGADRRAVTSIAGVVTIRDDSIASVRGSTVVPKVRGVTGVSALVGQYSAYTGVHIYERVDASTLDTLLRIDGFKRQLAVPVQLRPGEVWQHKLPRGDWMITTLSPSRRTPNGFRLRFGNAACEDRILNDPGRFICRSASGTVVFVERPRTGTDTSVAMTYLLVRTLYPPAPTTASVSR